MANQYVSVKHDSFKNKTTTESYELTYKLPARRFSLNETVVLNLRHVSCPPDTDITLIDAHFKSVENHIGARSISDALSTSPGEWAFLRNGELIIQINGVENISLSVLGEDSDVTSGGIGSIHSSACDELVWYQIDKEILKRVCDANTCMMQISGSAGCWTLEGDSFITMARAFYNGCFDETAYAADIQAAEANSSSGGCYVATAVYGSYDCPEVWTLRRFRDNTLDASWYGRLFIKAYYTVSPTIVRLFGKKVWFNKMWRGPLDRMVAGLQAKGIENTPYNDKY